MSDFFCSLSFLKWHQYKNIEHSLIKSVPMETRSPRLSCDHLILVKIQINTHFVLFLLDRWIFIKCDNEKYDTIMLHFVVAGRLAQATVLKKQKQCNTKTLLIWIDFGRSFRKCIDLMHRFSFWMRVFVYRRRFRSPINMHYCGRQLRKTTTKTKIRN